MDHGQAARSGGTAEDGPASDQAAADRPMRLPLPRGHVSSRLVRLLSGDEQAALDLDRVVLELASRDPEMADEDLQISLFVLYELHYQGFAEVDPRWEWSPLLLGIRARIELLFERQMRSLCAEAFDGSGVGPAGSVVDNLQEITRIRGLPDLAAYLRRQATAEQYAEFLVARSALQLKEADAQTWLIPRLTGRAKAALVEIQVDEYGSGRRGHLHQDLYAAAMRGCGLDSAYGAYIDQIPSSSLTSGNAMTMFGLHRRLRAAAAGYFAAFEATSSIPSQAYADAAVRLGLDGDVARYFDEHVEADAVHEQLAIRDLCGSLVREEPRLQTDVEFGAMACMVAEDRAAERLLACWRDGRSALRVTTEPAPAPVVALRGGDAPHGRRTGD